MQNLYATRREKNNSSWTTEVGENTIIASIELDDIYSPGPNFISLTLSSVNMSSCFSHAHVEGYIQKPLPIILFSQLHTH